MSDQFVGEIRIFPFNFAPTGWAMCDGQLLPLSQNTALFSLLGTNFGGNGTTNFALPNLQGQAPVNAGQGAGLSQYLVGQAGGGPTVTVTQQTLPAHTHSSLAFTTAATSINPGSNIPAVPAVSPRLPHEMYTSSTTNNVNMLTNNAQTVGGSQPHNNLQPYLTLNFCLALQGIFPPRN